ncbi:MAG: hypothetical protein O9322_00840 [Beijerinckiaceae bacterium]|nr:hypothetical protein [Beijerinckiaceae bacterium]MCZ8301814.1 hypothetical protein [Beijerinckiaceae bacterium]
MFTDVRKRLENQDKSRLMCPTLVVDVRFRPLEANGFVGIVVGIGSKDQRLIPTGYQHAAYGRGHPGFKIERQIAKKI